MRPAHAAPAGGKPSRRLDFPHAGRDHHANFKAFLAAGGIRGVLQESGLPISVEHSSVFWRDCREVVVVSAHR